jgi:hypothetical protein
MQERGTMIMKYIFFVVGRVREKRPERDIESGRISVFLLLLI